MVDADVVKRIAAVEAKSAIADVVHRRARAADRKDPELALTCYHEDGEEDHSGFKGLAKDFVFHGPTGNPDHPVKVGSHHISNIAVELADDLRQARVESYFLASLLVEKPGLDRMHVLVGGRYLDRFAERDGRWAIQFRRLVFDWSRCDAPSAAYWELMDMDLERIHLGRSDRTDPSYRT